MNHIVDFMDLRLIFKKLNKPGTDPPSVEMMLGDPKLSKDSRSNMEQWHKEFWESDPDDVAILKTWYCYNLSRQKYPVFFSAIDLRERLIKALRLPHYDRVKWLEQANLAAYKEFEIPKRRGGTRTIRKPSYIELSKIQQWIMKYILYPYKPHKHVTAFYPKRSIKLNAEPHVGALIIVNLDIEDFFHSIKTQRVLNIFLGMGYLHDVAQSLTNYCTCEGCLPQGAATSPALSNLACRKLDSRLSGISRKFGVVYTRYADDMTFSTKKLQPDRASDFKKLSKFFEAVKKIIIEEGFSLAKEKSKIMTPQGRQQVTGLIVNEKVNVPRRQYRFVRAVIHNCHKYGPKSQEEKYFKQRGGPVDLRASLYGHAHYINSINPDLGKKLLDELKLVNWNS